MSEPTANDVPPIQYHQNDNHKTYDTKTYSSNPQDDPYKLNDPFKYLLSPIQARSFPSDPTIILSARNVSYAANTLGTTTQIYNTPNYSAVQDLCLYFADWGCSYTVQEGAVNIVTITAPWDTISNTEFYVSIYSTETWELQPQVGTKNIVYSGILPNPYLPPTANGNYSVLPLAMQAAVQWANKNGGTTLNLENFTTSSGYSPSQIAAIAPFYVEAAQILTYMKAGIEGIPSYTQVLKRTAIIDVNNKDYAFNTSGDYGFRQLNAQGSINIIYSTNDLSREFAVPNNVYPFLLPSYSKQYGVQNVDQYFYYVTAGWLAKPPSFQFIGFNKVQLTQEFVWDEWASGLYYIWSKPDNFPLVYSAKGN